MRLKYSGKNVLVLGGSCEIGLETTRLLSGCGLNVFPTFYSNGGKLKGVPGNVKPLFFDLGTTAPAHKLDVSGAMYSRRYAAATSIDWNNGNTQSITLTATPTTLTFANGQDGGKYFLILKQDGTGSRTVSWPATVRFPDGTAPTLTTTAGKTDYIGFIYNGVDAKYDAVALILNL